ncbi:Uncharacterised protein [Rothia kristinae]|nr:Uncharacterised protein [Rothia kristinae]
MVSGESAVPVGLLGEHRIVTVGRCWRIWRAASSGERVKSAARRPAMYSVLVPEARSGYME